VRKFKCQHCNKPNPENWFICRDCGERASPPKFTTNSFIISEVGKRTDVEFNTISYDESISKMNKADKRWKGF